MTGSVNKPTNVFNFGFSHKEKIKLLDSCQDALLKEQITLIDSEDRYGPDCESRKLVNNGKQHSDYHNVFTDHKLTTGRKRCPDCKYELTCAIKTIPGYSLSADLVTLQTELGSNYTYRESERLFSAFSRKKRFINNHDLIKHTAEQIGEQVGKLHHIENEHVCIGWAEELIINVDGGHINATKAGKPSFVGMTAVIYRPEALNKQ